MGSDLIRPHVAVHALVTACCRGFADVVDALVKVNHNACKIMYAIQKHFLRFHQNENGRYSTF